MSAGPRAAFSHFFSTIIALAILAMVAVSLAGQNAQPPAPSTPSSLTILSREGRRALAITTPGNQEMVALDELAAAFQLAVREEAGALTVSYKGRTIVLTPDQTLASVSGRLISLSAAPVRQGGRWLVPLDFISRALAPMYDSRLDLRRPSRLLIVGDLRVPRVAVRLDVIGNAARITIDATPGVTSAVTQEGNQRLSVRFDADALDPTIAPLPAQAFVQGFRVVEPVTLGIDLGARFGAFRASSQAIDTTTRLVIDIAGTDVVPPQTTQAEPSPAELPQLGQPAPAVRTLAIDPGHGGDDVGAKGAGGAAEKDVALGVARRLKAAVEARLGIRVVMTRDDDRNVPVIERTALANNNKADLFISLHANASFRNSVSGAAIYTASFDDATDASVLSPERVPVFGGGMRDIELVPWNLAQIRHHDQSETMATILAEQFRDRIPLAARPVDSAPLRVLESANMPAVLVEIGYLTNADQEKQLTAGDFQNAVVQGILDAVVRFRDALGSEGQP